MTQSDTHKTAHQVWREYLRDEAIADPRQRHFGGYGRSRARVSDGSPAAIFNTLARSEKRTRAERVVNVAHSFGALAVRHPICVEGIKAALGGFTQRAVAVGWESTTLEHRRNGSPREILLPSPQRPTIPG